MCEGRGDACGDGYSGGRPVFGRGTLGNVDVDVPVFEDTIVDAQNVYVRLDVFEGNDGRLFHDVAEVAGKCQFARLSLAQRSLDEEDFASHRSPCQPSHYTSVAIALVDVAVEGRVAQEGFRVGRRDGGFLQFLGTSQLIGQFAQRLVDLLLELPYSAFAGIVLYDVFQCCLCKLYLGFVLVEASVGQLAWHEVAFGYFYLLLGNVSSHLYHLHAVAQGGGDGANIVGGGNEQYLREVIVYIEVVVMEGFVLLRVEHLKQGRGGVAVVCVACYLVYFVKYEHGVAASGLLYVLDDASGHGSNICTPVPTNLRLVVQTT